MQITIDIDDPLLLQLRIAIRKRSDFLYGKELRARAEGNDGNAAWYASTSDKLDELLAQLPRPNRRRAS